MGGSETLDSRATCRRETAPAPAVEELFARRARERPAAAALVRSSESLSYGELEAAANRLARRLVAEGVGPETLVGIRLDRSFEQVAAILAVLKAGGAFVPIDPEHPQERIRFLLEDSRVALVISPPTAAGEVPAASPRALPFESVRTAFAEQSGEPLGPRAAPDNLAYLLYTSGSTGRPKGTLVTRGNLARLLSAEKTVFDFGPSDVWILLHSCAFDFSLWEIFGALSYGARLVIVSAETARSPSELARVVDREGVTVLGQTPTAFFALAADSALEGRSLRYVVLGGEALDVGKLKPWFDRFGDRRPRLVNTYGLTETTIDVTCRELGRGDVEAGGSPIGRPLSDVDVYLVDPDGRLVPRGLAGEIWIGGAGVARGYLRRDDLTRERFLDDPFRPGPGRRVYRSGDLARERPDGDLEFLGRMDDQVQIRGYRVEPGEVAAVLSEHPSVRDAAVLARSGPQGPYLVGYAVPAVPGRFDEEELLRHLEDRLPAFMRCARVLAVERFPLTVQGKLDRAALPSPEDLTAAGRLAPYGETEEIVASLFAEATGAGRVSADDDFFRLGGHSLAAMRVAARLRDVFDMPASPSLLFERPTVQAIAAYVEERRGARSGAERPRFDRHPDRRALPMTPAQERVFALQRLHPQMRAYVFEAAIRFRGRLDTERLRRALEGVVERHEGLRTTFHESDGRPFQRVHEPWPVALDLLDFSALPRDEAELRLERLRLEAGRRLFDPAALPLVEWRLAKVAGEEHVLLHREHHLIHDGWSFVVFLSDLLEIYRASGEGRPAALSETLAPGDYAAAYREWIAGPTAERLRRYWEGRLRGARDLDLPTDRARPAVFSFRGEQMRFELPEDLLGRLREVARGEGTTLFVLLLAAFSILLSRLTSSEDVCIASGVANRHWPEVENTVGMLLNNLVFRVHARGEAPVREYLREVRDEVHRALAHQDLPFGEIVRASGVAQSLAETPLGRVFFSSYEGPLPELRLPDLEVELEEALVNGSAKFDWNLMILSQPRRRGDRSQRVLVVWEYATDLFERGTMERARRQFLEGIRSLLSDLDRPVADVAVSDEQERRFLLEAAEGPDAPYPRDGTIPELFALAAASRADAIALREGERTRTYRELDKEAERLASALRERGAGSDEVVAFYLPRGIAAVTTMLAIVKSGAAYLPLSTSDPPGRLSRLVAEAGARLVVTNRSFWAGLAGVRAPNLLLEQLSSAPAPARPARPARADSLAALLFTSGSTGEPKGVEVLHRGVLRLLFGADYAAFGPEEKILQLAPLSFDASTFEIWGALLHGGELVVHPEDVPSASALGEAIARGGITTMWLNASLFNAIVDESPGVLSPLQQLLIGGETLSVEHVRKARALLPDTVLVNGYGPTENTTFSCCYRIPREIPPDIASIPIGRPIAHSRARILDERGGLAPAGAVGELFVGGDGLARGYRHREESTAVAFFADPFSTGALEARLYKTGDLARLRPDSLLEFRGRRDSQVKIRGFRVELREIDSALVRLPGIAGASTQVLDDPARGRVLVATVVPRPGFSIEPEAVRKALARELPPQLVPRHVLERPALPITPHGKVDGALLLAEAREALASAWPPPAEARTALEGVVAAVFADVLGRPSFGADEDFFAAGGHSLAAFRVLARLEHALETPLEPSIFLRAATPRQIAEEIERRGRERGREGPAEDSEYLVEVTRGARPFFFVPGGEGGEHSLGVYARLAVYLPERSFLALRVRNDGTGGAMPASVEELAELFVRELRKVQSEGPYELAGGCIGGIVAFEMARQLSAAGQGVRRLVLLDTIYPSARGSARHRARGFCSRARRLVRDALQVAPWLRRSSKQWLYERFSGMLPFDEHEASPDVPPEWSRFGSIVLKYRPGPLRARTTLLASREVLATEAPRRWGAALCGGISVRELPGTHWSYIREHLAETGAALARALGEEP